MKWIKLDCDFQDDPKIQRLICELGFDTALALWTGLLALVGRYGKDNCCLDVTENGEWTWDLIAKRFNCRTSVLLSRVQLLAKLNLISAIALNENVIAIPNMMKRRDDYSTKKARKSGQAPDSVRTITGVSPDNVLLDKKRREEKRKEENPPTVPHAPADRPTDEAFEVFVQIFEAANVPVKYTRYRKADFIHLADLRKSQHVEARASPPEWQRACQHYIDSPRRKHTLADLCDNYAVFVKGRADKWGNLVEGNGNGTHSGNSGQYAGTAEAGTGKLRPRPYTPKQ